MWSLQVERPADGGVPVEVFLFPKKKDRRRTRIRRTQTPGTVGSTLLLLPLLLLLLLFLVSELLLREVGFGRRRRRSLRCGQANLAETPNNNTKHICKS